ncbi:unnamed protein product [Lepidochelys olivacea]
MGLEELPQPHGSPTPEMLHFTIVPAAVVDKQRGDYDTAWKGFSRLGFKTTCETHSFSIAGGLLAASVIICTLSCVLKQIKAGCLRNCDGCS